MLENSLFRIVCYFRESINDINIFDLLFRKLTINYIIRDLLIYQYCVLLMNTGYKTYRVIIHVTMLRINRRFDYVRMVRSLMVHHDNSHRYRTTSSFWALQKNCLNYSIALHAKKCFALA